MMPVVPAVSVCPTCAVPVIVGAPVAGVFGAADGRRRHAGQRLAVAGIVGEAHRHLDPRALVAATSV